MNVTENRPKSSCDVNIVPKKVSSLLKENDLKTRTTHITMPEDIPLDSEGCDDVPIKKDIIILKKAQSHGLTNGSNEKLSGESYSIKNVPCNSNDYLFDFCNQNVNIETTTNHKYYGCKRREYSSHYCESFGLPDDPIFSNSPLFVDQFEKSPLDTNLANPWDICVINLDYINQPWLIQDQEVITPYWDVESLFPFEIEDIRHKIAPENIDFTKPNSLPKELIDSSVDKEEDSVFTSTPLKKQGDKSNSSLSVVSTINIANKDDNNVDITLLKDQVLKALEEAIKKKKRSVANIDMKIQIVTDLNRSPETPSQKSSVEVRINECVDSESCQSSSSSKENYFIKGTRIIKNKILKLENCRNSNTVALSDWSEDWQDNQETEKFNVTVDSSPVIEKKIKKRRRKEYNVPSIPRNLRSTSLLKLSTNDQKEDWSNKILVQVNNTKRKNLSSSLNTFESSDQCKKETLTDSSVEISESNISQSVKKCGIRNHIKNHSSFKGKELAKIECQLEDDRKKHLDVCDNKSFQLDRYDFNGVRTIREKHNFEGNMLKISLPNQNSDCNFEEIVKNNIFGKKTSNFKTYTSFNIPIETVQRRITRSRLRNEISVTNQSDSSFEVSEEHLLEPVSKSMRDNTCVKQIFLTKGKQEINTKIISSDISEKVFPAEVIKKRVTRSSLRNEFSQSSSQSESDFDNSLVEKSQYLQEKSPKYLDSCHSYNLEKEYNKSEKLIGGIYTNKDLIATSKGESRIRTKQRISEIVPKRFLHAKINETTIDKNDHKEISFRRKLRSNRQSLKDNETQIKQERRRTLSGSFSENDEEVIHKLVPPRKRSVSANFDNKSEIKDYPSPEQRRLRSQVAETKMCDKLKDSTTNKDTEFVHNKSKSPKICFDLSMDGNDSPRSVQTNTQLKSILKNTFNGEQVHMPNLVICDNAFDDLPKLVRQDSSEVELDDKKPSHKLLKDNGITSRVRVIISPLDIKEENHERLDNKCPVLPLELPHQNNAKEKETQNVNEIKHDTTEIAAHNDRKSVNHVVQHREIKIENLDYNIGDFVWAQVAKYPYWPAVICRDPITDKFYNEVQMKNKIQMLFHIRFFGDSGKRAWVNRNHLMLYSSKQDLEIIAKKLKSETKSYNAVKPYLITGSQLIIDKWKRANEEIEFLRDKTPDEVVNYLIQCYQSFVNQRREKRKLNMIEASSESESEDSDIIEKHRRKRFKSNRYRHVAGDEIDHSVGFDEINISVGSKNNMEISDTCFDDKSNLNLRNEDSSKQGIKISRNEYKLSEICTLEHHNKLERNSCSEIIDNDNLCIMTKVIPRRSRRSLKTGDKMNVSDSQAERLENNSRENSLKLDKGSNLGFDVLTTSIKKENSSNSLLNINNGRLEDSKENIEFVESEIHLNKQQSDEASEVGSKTSSDRSSINKNMYSFEYQVELHKKNSLFNGLRNVKVCDYCMKQGDLYKCKGKCGGYFHLECASRVTQPRIERRHRNKEKSPTKLKSRHLQHSAESTPRSKRSRDCCKTRSQSQCQIITIKSKHVIDPPKKDNLPDNFHEFSISEQIDYGMKEMMSKFDNRTVYLDLTDTSSEEGSTHPSSHRQLGITDSPASTIGSEKSENKNIYFEETIQEEKSSDDLEVSMISENICSSIKHITADSVILTETETPMDITNLKCTYCRLEKDPPCFSCGLEVSKRGDCFRQKCSQFRCGRFYHPHCLKMWPQTQWSIGKWSKNQQPEDSFTCPAHTCHTCFSEELGSTAACRLPGDKLGRCLLCPGAFHTTTFCIPAGSEILGGSQIVCPRHRSKPIQPINTIWCFICSEGGNLVCCDMCPTSVHPECQPINYTDDDKYICEDCESGRFPLYDEIVWVKLGQYRWWPAIVLFPNEVPENVRALKHQRGDFAVRFFGTNDHYWVNKSRSFLFQEGDRGGSPGESNRSKNRVYEIFGKAIEDAAIAYKLKKEFKLRREAECISSLKPPSYIRINKNKPVGNVKCIELNLSNATACECDPARSHPCGPDSSCINRLLVTECDPDICRAGIRCRNQAFQKREYPPMVPYKTQGRGWGLKTLAPIKMGQFVIEYVGELIDSEEYQRRIKKMHEKKEENYYFMTVDSDRMIDAGPKGNLSRFMNHSCNPNCVTQKWTVKGDTRVGLFAKCNIDAGSELTFNYNLEVVGQEKKVCKCGATNCSGFIGVKAKLDKTEKSQIDAISAPAESRRSRKLTKKRAATPPLIPPCFMCGKKKSDITCNNKFCNKGYHLRCLKLEEMPDASKYACPRHNCNICSNRTIRCCVRCTNSFCPSHSDGNVRHDKFLGFVCRLHDPERLEFDVFKTTKRGRTKPETTDESAVSSTTPDETSNSKLSEFKKTQLEHDSALDADKNDQVSSSPTKHMHDSTPGTSEDELNLSTRLKRKLTTRKPRKKNPTYS